jgi:hypothetical protein
MSAAHSLTPLLSDFEQPVKAAEYPAYTLFTVLSCVILAVGIVYATRRWIQHRDIVPTLFLLGGGIATLFEPLLDVNGGVWYPETGGIEVFTLLDVRIPLFVFTSYIWIIGGQAYLCWRAFDERWALPKFLKLITFIELTDICTEFFGVGMGAYGYYGSQPFQVLGFPLWYSIVNTVAPLIGGAAFYLLRPYLTGWHAPLGVLMVPIGISASYCACGWPLWTGLQEEAPLGVMYLLVIPTALLAYTIVRLLFVVTKVPGFIREEQRDVRLAQRA